ncbi:MAG: helicase-related protein, partial [Verrucomicrobiota bacterium]
MTERSQLIEWIRGELVGPSRPLAEPELAVFLADKFSDTVALRRGPLAWRPTPDSALQEVLYYERESPHRKYGMGLLHPAAVPAANPPPDQAALQATDTIGAEPSADESPDGRPPEEGENDNDDSTTDPAPSGDPADDFEVTSPDVRHPSTIGISFCVQLNERGSITVQIPQARSLFWQPEGTPPFQLNGRYESGAREWNEENGTPRNAPVWRRLNAVLPDTQVIFARSELVNGRPIRKDVTMPPASPIALRVEVFPRTVQGRENLWLLTVVLRNSTDAAQVQNARESVLYQTFFEVKVLEGRFEKYPESRRPFNQLDFDEQSLALLYRESASWGIGHGCAAGWDADPNQAPVALYADIMPAVELPSMTPEIKIDGAEVRLSMRALANLPEDGTGQAWQSLESLAQGYAAWIQEKRQTVTGLNADLAAVASRHLDSCAACLGRINAGINLLRNDTRVRRSFRLANLAMLLQQIATKQMARRPLAWNPSLALVAPQGDYRSPWSIYRAGTEDLTRLGSWRAFQIAFLLMSLDGARDGGSTDREIVDLVWFPTGGGKTEAYLAVMAFYMFHERLLMQQGAGGPRRDGTNALMRYTLRMLTTQQFQRAASLICAMEFLRRNAPELNLGNIPGQRFSVGLWIGSDGSPNKIDGPDGARNRVAAFRRGDLDGNPLVLTECPWCRSQIGRYEGAKPQAIPRNQWNAARTRGITEVAGQGPLMHCPDSNCSFGKQDFSEWLPVEVIDERLYQYPPSLVIATADKLAMIAYRPDARALFGKRMVGSNLHQDAFPPGLIIQDELHLISGPLGTLYGLYEAIFERLSSVQLEGAWVKPKLIASTATIRGAAEQVMSVYARSRTQLFPSPGLLMGDSFFGTYARDNAGKLRDGRLYLGIHANDYGSVLTTQVRAFASALFRPFRFQPDRRDPWWTLLAFYNSIRELSGAKTLFDSDIRSRLKFMFNREGFAPNDRRNLRIVEELTARLSQAEIVAMMDSLSVPYSSSPNAPVFDACLASNIIEVGVDIDRLSLMGVAGQPKTTATYIQVTGRVGRRWWERAGLILMLYNPSKSRDRSHFEQFHSYHRRLYERVEPTTATPFAISALQRGLPGALLAWARVQSSAPVQDAAAYAGFLQDAYELLRNRCQTVQIPEDRPRSLAELERLRDELDWKWDQNPQEWETYPPNVNV